MLSAAKLPVKGLIPNKMQNTLIPFPVMHFSNHLNGKLIYAGCPNYTALDKTDKLQAAS